MGDRANQEIYRIPGDSFGTADIAHLRCFLMVLKGQFHICKEAHIVSNTPILGLITNATQQFLAHHPEKSDIGAQDCLLQDTASAKFTLIQVLPLSAVDKGPDRRVDEYQWVLFEFLSAL